MLKAKLKLVALPVLFAASFIACSPTASTINTDAASPYPPIGEAYYEVPEEFREAYSKVAAIEQYKKYVGGRKIFIDPGHGGEDKRNKSLMSKIVEADVNLRVALYLRKFLEEAGAQVFMSRDGDDTVELEDRAKFANESGAEIFISIHHNASPTKQNYWTDYTSTFYHSKEGEYEYEPCTRDLARYVQRDLAYVMRNSGGLVSFDGTVSDYILFPREGLYVLRKTEMPSILIECAFHTNRMEEKRLAIDEFNEIQAWGIFRGIAKYFAAGIPSINLLTEQSSLKGDKLDLVFQLADKFGINYESILVYFDNTKIEYSFDTSANMLNVNLSEVSKGEHKIRVVCANIKGNHSFPFEKTLVLK